MHRRNFLKTTSALLAGATLVPGAFSSVAGEHEGTGSEGRLTLPINRNWRYSRSSTDRACAKKFDDSSFERVAVPHTNLRFPGTVSTRRVNSSFPCTAGIAWCALDYNSQGDFGSGDRVCYHGVSDMFREHNCDHFKIYVAEKLVMEVDPDRKQFPPVKHEVRIKDFVSWLGRQGRSPAEVVLKQKLEKILGKAKHARR